MFGIAFVVALNVALRVDPPGDATIDWRSVEGRISNRSPPEPPQAVGGARPTLSMRVVVEQAEAQMNSINAENIQRLQTWSILAVVGLALASGVGGYMLSGMMLRPVRDITDVASTISATNLNERINHSGPDDELEAARRHVRLDHLAARDPSFEVASGGLSSTPRTSCGLPSPRSGPISKLRRWTRTSPRTNTAACWKR
ncbi:MAG: hypothetical protein U5Q44_09120 [Dehalococcoidia bacterium]|nr:hypothetical protein [Dehalococcoidia bacterium]